MFNQALFYHLLKYPLYLNQDDGRFINILIIGFGSYSQKFLDLSLQIGQIHEKILNIKIVSDDELSFKKYLSERPELENFFTINGTFNANKENYGNINFLGSQTKIQSNSHYIFIDTGDDLKNLQTAKTFHGNSILVSFVHEGKNFIDGLPEKIVPVYVNSDVKDFPDWPEIQRMALNVHLIWYKNLNVNFKSILDSFNNNFYNLSSSLSNVLSLKYKLHSIGIDIDTLDYDSFRAAAELFSGLNNYELMNELMYLEHRRWVTEKICEGWRTFDDLNDVIKSGAKDDKQKRHVCICRSRPDEKLSELSRENWDDKNFSLSELDELDAMSVKLHRVYSNYAEKIKLTNLLNGPEISGLRAMIDDSPEALSVFNEWFSCVQNIFNGDTQKVYLLKGRLEALERSLESLSGARRSEAAKHLKNFTAKFAPVVLASEYRDYKKDDAALIEKIPFILTYSDEIIIAVPFNNGENLTSLIGNCAAALVINPARIIYLCVLENSGQAESFRKNFRLVKKFLARKNVRAEINFLVSYYDGVNIAKLKNELQHSEFICVKGRDFTEFLNRLAELKADKKVFAVEKNDTALWKFLHHKNFSYYKFDMLTMNFTELYNCEILSYIPRKISISAADMLIFSQSFNIERAASIFSGDYFVLWEKYKETCINWKHLCNSLDEVSACKEIKFSPVPYVEPEERKYYFSVLCRPIVERVINFLLNNGFAYSGTCINGLNMNLCRVVIKASSVYASNFDEIFADPYVLAFTELEAVECWIDNAGNANIKINNLVVKDFEIPDSKQARELLKFFASLGYINNLKIDEQKSTFSYVSHSVRKLMTSAGRMLELYVYHKAEESGLFDDVVIGFSVGWSGGGKNEFDCIIVKGFKALCIECKAQSEIKNKYYEKLYKITNQLGVNAQGVLITDIRGDDTKKNSELRKNWRDKIITVYESGEIEDIAVTLQKILEGNYDR